MRPTTTLALALLLSACTPDESDPPTPEQRLRDLDACTPTDLTVLVPWTGPAFDPATGELVAPLPAGHVEALVNGWPVHTDEALQLRMEHGALVAADVFARDGLLGFQSVESLDCDLAMSHTLWRDEAAMYAFVASSPHVDAMIDADRMHHLGLGAHWTGEARDTAPTWSEGLHRYVAEALAALP